MPGRARPRPARRRPRPASRPTSSRRLLIDAPPLVLNLMIPGARGAAAAGLFEIARKLSTVPLSSASPSNMCSAPLVLGPGPCRPRPGRAALSFRQPGLDRAGRAARRPARLRRRRTSSASTAARRWRRCPCSASSSPRAAIEAIVGPAATIVEMIGHRALPLLNSLHRRRALDRPRLVAGAALWRLRHGGRRRGRDRRLDLRRRRSSSGSATASRPSTTSSSRGSPSRSPASR